MLDFKPLIDNSWTLFLDRDGVINHEKKADYIRNTDEFVFYDGVPQAIAALTPLFKRIVIVTNQKGVGRGWMSLADLENIHHAMMQEIEAAGGKIAKIYFCTDTDSDSPNRKPNPGMAFQAKADFADIDFSKSIMVGNKLSDMNFGRNAGIPTVFVATTNPETAFPHEAIDARFNSLPHFADYLTKP